MAWFILSGIGSNLLERLQYPWQPAFKSAFHEKKKSRLGRERERSERVKSPWPDWPNYTNYNTQISELLQLSTADSTADCTVGNTCTFISFFLYDKLTSSKNYHFADKEKETRVLA